VPFRSSDTSPRLLFTSSMGTEGTAFVFGKLGESPVEGLRRVEALGLKERWLINPDFIKVTGDLGGGGFGEVRSGTFHGSRVAIKIPSHSGDLANKLSALGNELRIFRQVQHPNIAMFYGAYLDAKECNLALVLELVEGPTLQDLIIHGTCHGCSAGHHHASDEDRLVLLFDICLGLEYLHNHNPPIVHGDLKPSNVMTKIVGKCAHQTRYSAKLVDFGLSRVVSSASAPMGGTRRWIAPEVAMRGAPLPSADIFSLGCVMYFTVAGVTPKGPRESISSLTWPPSDLTDIIQGSAEHCRMVDPDERPVILDVRTTLLNVSLGSPTQFSL